MSSQKASNRKLRAVRELTMIPFRGKCLQTGLGLNLLRLFVGAVLLGVTFPLLVMGQESQDAPLENPLGVTVATASGTSGGLPGPTSTQLLDESIDPYSGNFKAAVPLLKLSGRGSAAYTMSVSFESEKIIGTGMYPCCDAAIVNLYEGPSAPSKDYYNKLIRFGAGYGPGVLYATWTSYEGGWQAGIPATGANYFLQRRPTHLTFVDPTGKRYVLRDQEILGERIFSQMVGGAIRYTGSYNWYRSKDNQGKVYRSVEDNGMTFYADGIVTIPFTPGQRDWADHDNNLFDVPVLPSGDLYTRDGTLMRIDRGYVSWIRDKNGNSIKFTYEAILPVHTQQLMRVTRITDSLNRDTTIQYGSYTTPDVITYPSFNGTSVIKVQKTRLQSALQDGDVLRSLFSMYPEFPDQLQFFSSGFRYNPEVISNIEFADGKRFVFKYNALAELTRVDKPNGGITKYEYAGGKVNLNGPYRGGAVSFVACGFEVPDGFGGTQMGCYESWLFYRRLLKATNYLDANTKLNTVTYSRPESPGDDCPGCVKVDTLDQNDNLIARQKHYFYKQFSQAHFITINTLANDFPRWYAELEYKTESFNVVNGTPLLVKTIDNTWTHGPFNATPGVGLYSWWDGNPDSIYNADRPRITRARTTLNDTNQVSEVDSAYDQFMNITDFTAYDFGPGVTGGLLRRTHTDFLTVNASGIDYTDRFVHQLSLPLSTVTYSGAEGSPPIARTDYEYDNYAPDADRHSPLRDRAGITGLCMKYDSFGNCSLGSTPDYPTRGNLTSATSFSDAANGAGVITNFSMFDVAGNVVATRDGNGNVSRIEYDDAFTNGNHNTFAFATQMLSPIPDPTPGPDGRKGADSALVTTMVFDYSSGAVVSETDARHQGTPLSTSYSYLGPNGLPDPRGRVRRVTRPDGGWTSYDYGDDAGNQFIRTQTLFQTTPTQQVQDSYQYLDNVGRTIRTLSYDGSSADRTWSATDLKYDALGRRVSVSNPYFTTVLNNQVDPSKPAAVTEYDSLGRVKSITTPDQAKTITVYGGSAAMITDQGGRSRRTDTDALGRLVKVVEFANAVADPNVLADAAAGDFVTAYEYDALDDLRKVRQNSQTPREFTYDSLKRLKSALNPEDGYFTYAYDNNNNLKTRVDARNIKTDYQYDALNRLTKLSYSVAGTAPPNYVPAPEVNHFYDGTGMPANTPAPQYSKGQMTAVKSSVAQSISTELDVAGRVTKHLQIIDPQTSDPKTYRLGYEYNVAGQMTSETYPTGRIVRTDYDNADRVAGVGVTGYIAYVGAISYTAHGAPEAARLGNGLWEHTIFNSRLQATELGLGTSSTDSSRLRLTYSYGSLVNGVLDATKNNGNLQSQNIAAPGINVTQSYEYDYLNRVSMAQETNASALNWRQVYKYDPYGNRNFDVGTTTTDPNSPLTNPKISTVNYHIDNTQAGQTNVTYDSGGNLTQSVDGRRYGYDSENRQAIYNDGNPAIGGATYSYDGDGRRVKKEASGVTTVFVYDIAGRLIAEYGNGAGTLTGPTNYITNDILGTPRAISDGTGGVSRHDYYPFGEEIARNGGGNGGDTLRQKFTGKERDFETNLDFFGARYYSPALGRFTTPDEFNGWPSEVFAAAAAENPTFYADLANPQTLNKYEYANNNPLRYVDPTGHEGLWDSLVNWVWGQGDQQKRQEEQAASPWGVDQAALAEWYITTLGESGVAHAQVLEDYGADFGVNEVARQLAKDRNGEVEYFGMLKATVGMTSSILLAGIGGEVEGAVSSTVEKGILNKGGRFAELKLAKGADEVAHHMPQAAALEEMGISYADGPALGMTKADHALTSTFSGRGAARMRADIDLTPRQRLAKDLLDIRSNFGTKYNQGMLEMLEYTRTIPAFQK